MHNHVTWLMIEYVYKGASVDPNSALSSSIAIEIMEGLNLKWETPFVEESLRG